MLVNRRHELRNRAADLTTAFQVCLSVTCAEGLVARADLSSLKDADFDRRLADLQYRDVVEYAVGLNTSADWQEGERVTTAWTEPLPMAEVLRVAPNQNIGGVTWGMEDLVTAAASAGTLQAALSALPDAYAAWIDRQEAGIANIDGASRQATAYDLVVRMRQVKDRIGAGIELLAQRCASAPGLRSDE